MARPTNSCSSTTWQRSLNASLSLVWFSQNAANILGNNEPQGVLFYFIIQTPGQQAKAKNKLEKQDEEFFFLFQRSGKKSFVEKTFQLFNPGATKNIFVENLVRIFFHIKAKVHSDKSQHMTVVVTVVPLLSKT